LIKLPPFSWFVEGNAHSGSSGTDPGKGALSTNTFNFNVNIDSNEDQDKIIAVNCFIQPPWPDKADKSTINSMNFPFSPEGLQQAENWLNVMESNFIK